MIEIKHPNHLELNRARNPTQLIRRIGHKSVCNLVQLSQRKAKITFPLIRTIHVYIWYCRQLVTARTPMLQALFIFPANVLVGKCLFRQMYIFLGRCPSGQISSGQMSFWANVLLGKPPSGQTCSGQTSSGQMFFWANVFLGKRLLGKRLMGKCLLNRCLLGKCCFRQMSLGKCLWANVSGQMLYGQMSGHHVICLRAVARSPLNAARFPRLRALALASAAWLAQCMTRRVNSLQRRQNENIYSCKMGHYKNMRITPK
jgi:hypothetical protein